MGVTTLPVDNSLAAHAYRIESVRLSRPDSGGRERAGWTPVVDGIGRMGVLRVTAPENDAALLHRRQGLSDPAAIIRATMQPLSDVLARTMRTRSMRLQAELP
ncbi:hypothetical protein [Streptomyces sp. LMG1-1-1.1]|uniref:hypothetical protein n=1 Tax=Streptomyces sp. LMG1-1-1.1 TaxID=3135245 RepID=UPI0034654C82